jgi:hypothetical protein
MFFIKGNVDVHDSLHSCRLRGEVVWNGINEVLRVSHPSITARMKHETWTRSDASLQATGTVPEAILSRKLDFGSHPAPIQFSRALLETKADVIVLSVQADITNHLMKHKSEGFLIFAADAVAWSIEDKQWLKSDFERVDDLDVAASMGNLTTIIEKIREHSETPILIYNVSPINPGEIIHCHQGLGESYSTRIKRFNLGLVELSEKTGVSIIDVDNVLARKGADALKLDMMHLTPEGNQLIAEEVVRVLADLGVLDEEAA